MHGLAASWAAHANSAVGCLPPTPFDPFDPPFCPHALPATPGAFGLDGGMLRGRTLLNLDTGG